MHVPSFYKTPPIEVYKERNPTVKIHAESEKEKELKKRKWEKDNSPSPTSYQIAESFEKTQTQRVGSVKIIKELKIPKFTEIAAQRNKWVPPVGSYNLDDKVYNRISKPKGYK